MIELYQLPLLFALAGLAFYVVLGGADFGAGFWQLAARRDPEVREQTYRAIDPNATGYAVQTTVSTNTSGTW